jgi:hypothetical protein
VLTVYTTPVIYLYMRRYWKHLKKGNYAPPAKLDPDLGSLGVAT